MLTAQQFTNMVEAQDRLNKHLRPDWYDAGFAWSTAIFSECSELIDQVGWKWWKHTSPAPLTQIHLEVVDIWHFVLSHLIECGPMTLSSARERIDREPDMWSIGEPLNKAQAIRRAKILAATACMYPNEPLRVLPEFFSLMRACRLSFDELYQLYMGKSVLNLFRWNNGYLQGKYQKTWGDVEDNVYLETILKGKPNMPFPQITTILQQRYQEIAP